MSGSGRGRQSAGADAHSVATPRARAPEAVARASQTPRISRRLDAERLVLFQEAGWNMTCDAASWAIEAMLLGELDIRRMSEMRMHVETCSTCRERYERATRVDTALSGAGLGMSEVRVDWMRRRILERTIEKREPSAPRARGWLPAIAVAATV